MGAIWGAVREPGRWRAAGGSRAGRAAAVGAGLGLCWIALTLVDWNDLLPCDHQAEWDCLGVGLLFLGLVALVSLLASWLALRLAGVRPAWWVVAVAVLLSRPATVLGFDLLSWGPPWAVLPVGTAALFALAAALTAPGPRFRRSRTALLAALLLAWLLAWFLGRFSW
ncbi:MULTISPECIES: hypothetical protein [Kitasatospora]|uniref:Uncharacterized protein n=1 Tax=Kitasatospora setae (strain ATCC 33774 / DSM 43861 / JCM 3304 / KCC A-0304 / NBRC 14216 / KM-6054) TaxID=452652 RepID=E4N4S7_KITSK|nr:MULTISPECIES: hypothetical protein [Kitasatospora]BAJ26208.1 hypothetical protein KSE_03610 [Kitasatospora setae KM-6054]